MAEQEFSEEERAAAYEYAREKIAEAKSSGVPVLDLDPSQHQGKTAALSVLPPEIAELGKLTSLDLQRTQVADLAPLRGLSGLRELTLDNTQVSDLSGLQGLSGLQTLRLDNTEVSDLSDLQGLSGLQTLDLDNTQVSDLSDLQGLSGLQRLTLNNTQVSDLSGLQGLSGLRELFLNNTQVSDLSDLQGLSGLQRLYLNNTQVSDLSGLQGLSGLQTLRLNNTQVSDLSDLQGLSGLQTLTLDNTQVSDLSDLQGLSGLQRLYLNNTQVSDLSGLQGLSGLQTLRLNNTQVSDLSGLQGLSGLQTLFLNDTQVSDLSDLQGLSGLQTLRLNNTQVSDLSDLQGLSGLQTLRLNNTQVSDLSDLQGLSGLQTLYLNSTQVSDLSDLQGLSELQTLALDNTRVADLLPLAGLSRLGEDAFDGLWFNGTPVADRDDTHRSLAAIENNRDRARQVLQYLNGEHPKFGGPPEPYVPTSPNSPLIETASSGSVPEIEWEKQDPYGLSFTMTGHLLALNFSASEPAPLAQQILPELREALRQLVEKLRGANFGIRQELFAEAELMAQMVAADIEEIEGQAVLLWFKSINLGSFIDRDEMARSDGRHEDDLLSAEHLSSLRRVVRASAPFVREFPEARKLDEAHRERKIDSFDPGRLFSVIERAVQAFVLEADAAGVLKQAVEIGSGSGDEATRARTVAGVSENNFWTIVARAAANYGKYAALVAGSAALMVTEGALNKVGSDLADHYRLSHSAVQLLQTIPNALLISDDRPEDVKQTLLDAKVSIRDVKLPPIPSRRPLAPFEAPAPPKRP